MIAASLAIYVGYKNRPGGPSGRPAYYMDPAQTDARVMKPRLHVDDNGAGWDKGF